MRALAVDDSSPSPRARQTPNSQDANSHDDSDDASSENDDVRVERIDQAAEHPAESTTCRPCNARCALTDLPVLRTKRSHNVFQG